MPLYLQLLHAALSTELAALTPIIIVLLIIGLATALVQGALQIDDPTFALLPKTVAMIVLALSGGFGALTMFETLANTFITNAPNLVRQPWY